MQSSTRCWWPLPDNTTIRKFIRHPVDVPIQVTGNWEEDDNDETIDQTITNVSLGGIAFISLNPLDVRDSVRKSIYSLERDTN
mgnify:CR=1 FL=1